MGDLTPELYGRARAAAPRLLRPPDPEQRQVVDESRSQVEQHDVVETDRHRAEVRHHGEGARRCPTSSRRAAGTAPATEPGSNGRLTGDPELRSRSNGQSVCAMRLAVDGPRDGATTFIDVTAFDRLADTCGEYLSQGRAVARSGRLAYSEWEADDGSKRSKHEIVANQVDFLTGGRPEGERTETTS